MSKLVKSNIASRSVMYQLDGLTIDEAVAFLQTERDVIKVKYPEVTRIALDVYYNNDDNLDLQVLYFLPESDEEYRKRVEAIKKQEEERKQRDLVEYNRIAKKYGLKKSEE